MIKYNIEINDEVKTIEVKDKQLILVLQGCPASGKSTFAKKLEEASKKKRINRYKFLTVCRDDIRVALGIKVSDFSREDEVTIEQIRQARQILDDGYSLIVADTNLNPKYVQPWYDMSFEYGIDFEKCLLYIPYWDAIKRDKTREVTVGRRVVERFYRTYFPERLREDLTDKRKINESFDPSNLNCIICDLDGTLALHQGRTPYQWEYIHTDKMDIRMARLINEFAKHNVLIIFLTGRPENVREATEKWLNESFEHYKMDVKYNLIMRPITDIRKGAITKKDLYEKFIESHRYNTLCVFEDSNTCTEMWRSLGLLTCQVANGEY